ncbi:helix-turn-helix domain-containing protein [Melghirimyces algeriensis]|uniref:Tetratricopeptide repeat-containing protein n=1 Tax=Melghirimyces algeriensis TaxID=910412 RepID=A0A521DDG4_9BACL|nr:helix-turn-helix transcriptional regulator [Melghirimyces algeriensis]SMO69767.1 Tetratricopeptide repeat-containing protein [Melghirimyces algeriensis]
MESLQIRGIGEAIRSVRKSRGLRLEDVADDQISTATISNIERGVGHVNTSKVYYLLEKMGLSMDQIPSILMEQEEAFKELEFNLTAIEAVIAMKKSREALAELENIDLEESHPYAARVEYLKGKAFQFMNNWKRAERCFTSAIRLCNQNDDKENIEAASFSEYGVCCYFQNELEKALEFTNSGLAVFQEEGGRKYVKFVLLRNKVVYLERLGRALEGLNVLQDVWGKMDQIKDIETVLTFYTTRADLLRKTGMYDEAIQYAKEGLGLARINKHYKCMFDLWTILGTLYTSKKQWSKAERCFNTALTARHLLDSEKALTDIYVWLGILSVQQNKWEEAKSFLEQGIANAEKHNDAPKLIYALRVMGDFWKEQDEKQEAIPYYERALQVAKQFHYKKAENRLYYRLSQCYEERNRKEFEQSLLNMYETQLELKNGESDLFEEQ